MKKIKAYGICLYKIDKKSTRILLCKSTLSLNKWGCLKGIQKPNESNKQTACREFEEESNIKVSQKLLAQYFEQKNQKKDIGIYLVNALEIKSIHNFFYKDILYNKYLCQENSRVKFFDIDKLPSIKQKQSKLIYNIIDFLRNMN